MTITPETSRAPRVLRWEVPVSDEWILIGGGPVLHAACRGEEHDIVHVWTMETTPPDPPRRARVFGTGHDLTPETGRHLGTGITAGGSLVWHVFELADSGVR